MDDRRRHGDVFPLPSGRLRDRASFLGIDEPQRAFWMGQALNKLALHDQVNSLSRTVLSSNLPFTAVQDVAADRIMASLRLHPWSVS